MLVQTWKYLSEVYADTVYRGLPGVSPGRMPMSYVYAGSITFDYIGYINEAW